MNKKALIFDCFGVVASSVLGPWAKKNLSKDFNIREMFEKIDMGDITEEEALHQFSASVNRPSEVVRKEIDSHFIPNQELIDFINYLKSKYKIILLTNAHHSFFERLVLVDHPNFFDPFHDVIISSKIKMIKPNKDIFLHTLEKNSLKPEDVVFIDDQERNIVGAQEVGIDSVLFESTDQLKSDLLKYNIS